MKLTACQILFILCLDTSFCFCQQVDKTSKGPKFLTIHGTISYDFFYRSKIDTPINEQNFQQHAERVQLNITLKEKYPFNIRFVGRQSNSSYFKNFYDPNIQFDWYGYQRTLKQALIKKLQKQYSDLPDIKLSEAALESERRKYDQLKAWIESPGAAQQLVEEREQQYTKKYDSLSTFKTDSTKIPFSQLYESKIAELEEKRNKIISLQKKTDSIKNAIQKGLAGINQKVYGATNARQLKKIASGNGISLAPESKFEKYLSSVKGFSIGKSFVNYTELTAQNISITGLNVEFNPSYYAAFAAGKIDYQFRDFYTKSNIDPNQYLVLGRLGIGDIDKKVLIVTYYQGRKNISEYSSLATISNQVTLMGYSLEAIYKKDANNGLSIEFAKSTKPAINFQGGKETGALWKYSDNSNMGINIKGQLSIKKTHSKLSGFFRKTGENFQSFSLFTYNTDQMAWQAKVDQNILKRKLSITAMLRQNDFTNPFTDKTFKSTTTFKSIQINARFPKYPSLSLGYYPGTQLYIINKEQIKENAYYILNGSLVYSYQFKNTGMNSSLVLNRYYNKATDSGFVMYKGLTYYASQTVFFKKFQAQAGYTYTSQPELEYQAIEASINYSISKRLKIDVSNKYNKVKQGSGYWGGQVQLNANLSKAGTIQLQYDKSYFPSIQQTLYPMETCRMSWSKTF